MITRFVGLAVALVFVSVMLFAGEASTQGAAGWDFLDSSGQVIESQGTPSATDPACAFACVDATGAVTAVLSMELHMYTGQELQCEAGESLQVFNQEQLPAWHDELVKQSEYLDSLPPKH